MYYILAARRQVKHCIFHTLSKILKRMWSAVLYFTEKIQNKNKSGTDDCDIQTVLNEEQKALLAANEKLIINSTHLKRRATISISSSTTIHKIWSGLVFVAL